LMLQMLLVGDPAGLLPARLQMALSLGWHIILSCFGVAFPSMIFVLHRRGIVRDDPVALGLAQRWAKVSAVLFAVGAVSGTVLSFEMGLLWPGLMGRFGDVLGLPFAAPLLLPADAGGAGAATHHRVDRDQLAGLQPRHAGPSSLIRPTVSWPITWPGWRRPFSPE
jgi:hypothetical protein